MTGPSPAPTPTPAADAAQAPPAAARAAADPTPEPDAAQALTAAGQDPAAAQAATPATAARTAAAPAQEPDGAAQALEDQIGLWREAQGRHRAISVDDLAELEDHLRGQIADLAGAGLDAEESFLVAVRRLVAFSFA
ncbi:MAG: hypothetical protein LBD51_02440 [Bifidobacteriaceae bacterium]|jgi:hypothetical protein|nr:hypothetical protein [Bifidobacteriaceae bacterium]